MKLAATGEGRIGAAALVGLALCASCAARPPAHWQGGGTEVDIPRARWLRGDLVVDVVPEGRVLVGGMHVLSLDRAGRVFDLDADPVALLEVDGSVTGPDDEPLGKVGWGTAARAGEQMAWLVLNDSGEVLRIDEDGAAHSFGIWSGCGEPRSRVVCTLLTHLFASGRIDLPAPPPEPVGMGFGAAVVVP
ncbi:MAG: hypothetical protein HY744_02710 [Deltaproteobacteria bacterium]|nr:hypothetical protein [Deltaproteobacteria bacterium]